MAKRTPKNQSAHDEAIARSAGQYKGKGYEVQADIAGYDQPESMGGRRPDLVVEKGRDKKVIEFETPESIGKDRAQ